MTSDQVTRCPHCHAVFRVAPALLAQAGGWLRCGQCRSPFDSTGLTVPWAPDLEATPERMDLESLLKAEDRGTPAAETVEQAVGELLSFERALASFQGATPEIRTNAAGATPDAPSEADPSRPGAGRGGWRRAAAWSLVLALLASLQLAWGWRNAWWQTPWVVEAAQSWCARMACQLPAWQAPDFVRIDSSQFVRTDRGYQLEWSLRNLSSWPLHMPSMELVLTQDGGGVLVRRVITPAEMAAPQRLAPDQRWDGVLVLSLQDDLPVSGYRLLAFYP